MDLVPKLKTHFMFGYADEFTPQPYKFYKNNTMERHRKRVLDTVRQINDCSLKPEDKKKLKEELINILKS